VVFGKVAEVASHSPWVSFQMDIPGEFALSGTSEQVPAGNFQ